MLNPRVRLSTFPTQVSFLFFDFIFIVHRLVSSMTMIFPRLQWPCSPGTRELLKVLTRLCL